MPLNYDSFRNNENSQTVDILNKISQGDKSDLLGIQASDYLNQIKNMIKIPLEKSETDRIDGDFKDSLKEMIVINNNNITKEYLEYLSYIYYALYNNTLAVYDDLKRKNIEIDYYMLDQQFYNSIAEIKIEWEKYNKEQRKDLREAYKYGFFNEVWELMEINNKFYIHERLNKKHLMQNCFKDIIETFDKKMLAQTDLYVFADVMSLTEEEGKQELINYLKELYKTNPDICFYGSDEKLKNLETIKDALSVKEVAFLTTSQKYHIESFAGDGAFLKDRKISFIKYYYNILKINPDYEIKYEGRKCIEQICLRKIQFPPEIFVKLTDDEIKDLEHYFTKLKVFSELKDNIKINVFLKSLLQKYAEQEEYKVYKKGCKVKWRR